MNRERKRVCCNCGNIIRKQTIRGYIYCYCAIDGQYIGYFRSFTHWCRRWKKIKECDNAELLKE